MSTDNVSSISAAKKPSPALAGRIEKVRQRLFNEVMPFVETTRLALDEEDHGNERDVLSHAMSVLDRVAAELERISKNMPCGNDDEDES